MCLPLEQAPCRDLSIQLLFSTARGLFPFSTWPSHVRFLPPARVLRESRLPLVNCYSTYTWWKKKKGLTPSGFGGSIVKGAEDGIILVPKDSQSQSCDSQTGVGTPNKNEHHVRGINQDSEERKRWAEKKKRRNKYEAEVFFKINTSTRRDRAWQPVRSYHSSFTRNCVSPRICHPASTKHLKKNPCLLGPFICNIVWSQDGQTPTLLFTGQPNNNEQWWTI